MDLPVAPRITRQSFRPYPLDGAMLYFHPPTGTHLRLQNESTSALRRQAPRVAMFGITNACNLRCGFCSRDVSRPSAWTVASAADLLRGLAAAGTLEVAFGGGEPFAFRGFAELVAELHRTTALALNVTTNGTLIHPDTFGAYAGHFGQVRVSIYPDTDWRQGCRVLADHGQRWGANLIVDPAALVGLPALLAELAALGCRDVSLLSYVGPDPRLHLSPQGRVRLAAIIDGSPVACRLSVCFGDSVPAPRLFDGSDHTGDCGAGLDFVSITPDQRMQACSFHDGGLPAASAAEVLHGWRHARDRLGAPSLRDGCARRTRRDAGAVPRRPVPPIAVWQAFSGNNSGECIMVAKFDTPGEADAYLAQLLPGWTPDGDVPAEWRRLFTEQRVSVAHAMDEAPAELLAIGRSVVAAGYDAGDMLAELRALAWKQGARLVPGGVHLHDGTALLAAVRADDRRDAQALAERPPHPAAEMFVHGPAVLALLPRGGEGAPASIGDAKDLLAAWAAHRPLGVEVLFEAPDRAAFIEVKKKLANTLPTVPRLVVRFWGNDDEARATRFAQEVTEASATVAGGCVLVTGRGRWKRLAVFAFRQGADVMALEGEEVAIFAHLSFPDTSPKAAAAFDATARHAALQALFPQGTKISVTPPSGRHGPPRATLQLRSTEPEIVLASLAQAAREHGTSLWISVTEVDPLAFAVRRVIAEVQDRAASPR